MQVIHILLVWISGFLSVSQGQSESCLTDFNDQCPLSSLVPGEKCVFIFPTKENYPKAQKECEGIGRSGRLLDLGDLAIKSVRGCLRSIHPHPKYKMIWLEGRYACTLHDLTKKADRDPGCKKKRYFACIVDAYPVATTEAESSPSPTAEYTTEPRSTEEDITADFFGSTLPWIDVSYGTQWSTHDSTESETVGGQLSSTESTDTVSYHAQGHSTSESGGSSSSDASVTTYILTLSEDASTVKPDGSSSSAADMQKPTGQDNMRTSGKQGLPTSGETSQGSGMLDFPVVTPSLPPNEESSTPGMPSDMEPAVSAQCQYPDEPAVCPSDWVPISDNLCLSVNWNERVNLTVAEESCVTQGGELLKAGLIDQNIDNCLREVLTRDYPNTLIFRLAGEDCLGYSIPGDALSTCDAGSSFAFICAIHENNTGSSSMDAAPVAGITLGVAGTAILVYHILKLRK